MRPPASTDIDAPPVILCTPRTGSTWVYHLLLARLIAERGERVRGLHEPFNILNLSLVEEPDGSLRAAQGKSRFAKDLSLEEFHAETRERARRLARARERAPGVSYLCKVFAGSLPGDELEELCARHPVVLLERRDPWEQFLSFALAASARRWSSRGEPPATPRELRLDPVHVSQFTHFYFSYRIARAWLARAGARVLVYEDCLARDIAWVLDQAGYPLGAEAAADLRHHAPPRLPEIDKLACFADPSEIRRAYLAAGLPRRPC